MAQTMTKADLIDVVHRRTGLSKREATRSVETFVNLIGDALIGGHHVKLANFGTFRLREPPNCSTHRRA